MGGILDDPVAVERLLILVIACGFIAYVFYDHLSAKEPLSTQPITSNLGSRMVYIILVLVITGTGMVAGYMMAFVSVAAAGAIPDPLIVAGFAVLSLMVGAAFARAALERAKDAGKDRRFALLGIVPVLNLWLVFAAPKASPDRPPYIPASTGLRVVIGLIAGALLGSLDRADQALDERLDDYVAIQDVVAWVEQEKANLPIKVDDLTTLYDIQAFGRTKDVEYIYEYAGSSPDTELLRQYLESTVKPSVAEITCTDPRVTEQFWTVWYRYFDQAERLLAEMSVGFDDCQDLRRAED